MPSAASGSPRAFSMWNSEIFSSSGQPASGTPKTRLLEGRAAGGFLLQALRAGVLALLVAPDAVVRLVQRADEVGALVGELEAVALPQMVERVLGEAARGLRVHRNEAS